MSTHSFPSPQRGPLAKSQPEWLARYAAQTRHSLHIADEDAQLLASHAFTEMPTRGNPLLWLPEDIAKNNTHQWNEAIRVVCQAIHGGSLN